MYVKNYHRQIGEIVTKNAFIYARTRCSLKEYSSFAKQHIKENNMKKILIAILVVSLTVIKIFAQEIIVNPIIPETQGSVRKMATAYVFGTETDAISAGSIYDLSGSFFSLGHTPSTASYPMATADFGLAITPSIFLGIASGFDINDTKITTSDGGIKTNRPSFFSTIAFGLNKKFGFHYNVANATVKTDITNLSPASSTKATESVWLHQFSFAMRISKNFKYTIPVGVVINKNENATDVAGSNTTTDASKIIVFLNPNFTIYPDTGVVTQLKAGVEVDFGVYDAIGSSKTTTGTTTVQTKKNTDTKDILWRVYATPTFEWTFFDRQLRFMSDPTLAFDMTIVSDGKPQNAPSEPVDTVYMLKPSINIPVAAVYKPVNWFEFRTGLLYNIKWEIVGTNSFASPAHDYGSLVLVFAGFGFTISDDFAIDLAFQSDLNKVRMDSLSVQLTYRF